MTSTGQSPAWAPPDGPAHLLVTGGAGFIGSCYVRMVLARRDGTRVTVLDKLTYAASLASLEPARGDPEQAARLRFVRGDIADAPVVAPLVAEADAVLNFAAETHVDRSLQDAAPFLRTGVVGVHVLLEAVRSETERARAGDRPRAPRLVQVSTDEVYGEVAAGRVDEDAPLRPISPYAAAKAAGDLLVGSYVASHRVDAVVTRGSNTYGPYQHPEKLIPLFVTNALLGLPLPLYGDGRQRRDWLHVEDHAAAVDHVLRHAGAGTVFNVPGGNELPNLAVVERLLASLALDWATVRRVADRPGHDRRYALDGRRLAALGWAARVPFEDGLAATVDWYRANEAWWRAARSGAWEAFYGRQYGVRLAASQPVAVPVEEG